MSDKLIGILFIVFVVLFFYCAWLGISWLFGLNTDYDEINNYYYESSKSYFSEKDCSYLEPENSYDYGSGHYAGFDWAERTGVGYCSGNSNSFIEGCEEYLTQEEAYANCLAN